MGLPPTFDGWPMPEVCRSFSVGAVWLNLIGHGVRFHAAWFDFNMIHFNGFLSVK